MLVAGGKAGGVKLVDRSEVVAETKKMLGKVWRQIKLVQAEKE